MAANPACPDPVSYEKTHVIGYWDVAQRSLIFEFSREVDTSTFEKHLDVFHSQGLIKIGKECLGYINVGETVRFQNDGQGRSKVCRLIYEYKDNTAVSNVSVEVSITGWNDSIVCAVIPNISMRVEGDLRYYNDLQANSHLQSYSKYSAIALKATLGISFFTSTRSFSSLLKLT